VSTSNRSRIKSIPKKALDETIRLARKYWKTGDGDILPAKYAMAKELSLAVFNNDCHWYAFTGLIDAIVCGHGLRPYASNKEIYAAFKAVGYAVSDNDQPAHDSAVWTAPEGHPGSER
jgi:hypothetical protein